MICQPIEFLNWKYFNGFQSQNSALLWLTWVQTMKMKQNQTFFRGTYSNLTRYFFLSRNIFKYFNDFQNRNSSVIWLHESNQWKRNRIRHFSMRHNQIWPHIFSNQEIWKYLRDFQNRNFSVLLLKWTQTIKMQQNQTIFHGTYSNLTSYFIGRKILKNFNDFYNFHLLISSQNYKIKRDTCQYDKIFRNL